MAHGHHNYLAKTAKCLRLPPLEEMRRIMEEEWSANSSMLPANWRERRLLYTMELGAGWIDIAQAATLTVLNDSIPNR